MFRIRDLGGMLMAVMLGLMVVVGFGPAARSQVKAKPPPAGAKLTAEQLAKAFLADPSTANANLKNKVIEFEGTVFTANPSIAARGGFIVNGAKKDKEAAPLNISCQVVGAHQEKSPWLGKGQKVRVKGKVLSANNVYVMLVDCEFTELTPRLTTPTVTAEKLAAAFAQDEKSAEKKYLGKEIIVEGVIEDLGLKDGVNQVKLTGVKPDVASPALWGRGTSRS